ncbi:MAG: hypothetical protein M0O94_09300, partial [Bacteroidales bacterium]|nr:hypothetical protein [Bacteroidales bacterium]
VELHHRIENGYMPRMKYVSNDLPVLPTDILLTGFNEYPFVHPSTLRYQRKKSDYQKYPKDKKTLFPSADHK